MSTKAIPNQVFTIGKEKFGLSRLYHAERSSPKEFAPVNLTSPLSSNQAYGRVARGSGEIQIEFPSVIIARFSGMAETHAAMQLLTQICGHHVIHDKMGYEVRMGDVFIFINRQRTTMKLLHAEDGGLVLYIKSGGRNLPLARI